VTAHANRALRRENRRHSRGLGWRARVSGRQILEFQVRTGGFAAPVSARHFQFPFWHARDRFDMGRRLVCGAACRGYDILLHAMPGDGEFVCREIGSPTKAEMPTPSFRPRHRNRTNRYALRLPLTVSSAKGESGIRWSRLFVARSPGISHAACSEARPAADSQAIQKRGPCYQF
jgi:hypothetical protein